MRKKLKRPLPVQGSRDGKKQKCQTRGWNDLPHELEADILSRLSLLELAVVSGTRKTFLAAFRGKLAEQQKALCDVEIARFGRAKANVFADLVRGCLADDIKFEDLRARFAPLDVGLHPVGNHLWLETTRYPISGMVDPVSGELTFVVAKVIRYTEWVRNNGRIRRGDGIRIAYLDFGQKWLGWISMLQALLSEGVFSSSHDGLTVCINPLLPTQPLAFAPMKAHAAPLLPSLAKCTFEWGGQKFIAKQPIHVGQGGADANKGITLVVRGP